jgi:hypothetical protein
MHLTAPSHWSRSIVTGGRDASERVVTIVVARTRPSLSAVQTITHDRQTMGVRRPTPALRRKVDGFAQTPAKRFDWIQPLGPRLRCWRRQAASDR